MATDTRKLQLQTTVDASGAKAGFNEIKTAGKDMAQSVSQSGQEASKGLDAVGTGAQKSAAKVDSATKNVGASLQRYIASLETGKKTGVEFFESIARQRGANLDSLRPLIEQARELEARTKAATVATAELTRATTSLGATKFNKSFEGITTSLGATDHKVSLDSVGTSLGAAPIKAATEALKPFNTQVDVATTRVRGLTAASQDLSRATTSLGASGFSKALGNPSTSLGATSFGAVAEEAKKAEASTRSFFGKTTVSAGQTKAALAQLPAQFSDIVVSLQGGQRPLSVLLQQGSQIKDSFGGIGPAAKALGGYVIGLINPFTVAAAAIGTLGVAMYQGAKETTEYNKALTLTGNYLGVTVSQLQDYAKAISSTVGTQSAAAEALTSLASSGKVATTSLTSVGTAVVEMNRVLGTSVDEATKVFVQLADEPTKASAKLNESMHYLNLATYERIRALEEQGDKEGAAALAQTTYANETTARLQKVEAQAGTLEKGWRLLADGAKAAWDAMLGAGRAQSIGDALATAQQKLSEAQAQVAKGGLWASLYGPQAAKEQEEVNALSRKALRESENAAAEGERAKTNAAQIGASERIKILSNETKTNADKRKKAIADLKRDFQTLGKAASGAEYDKLVSGINERFKDPKGAKAKAYTDDAATRTLATLRESESSLKAQLETDDKLTASENQRAKFVQQIADLKGKTQLTADQKSLLAAKDQVLAQLDINVALEKQIVAKEKQKKLDEEAKRNAEEFARQIQGINISIESANRSRGEQQDRVLASAGLGDRAAQELDSQRALRREYESYKRQLTKDAAEKNQLGSEAYKEEVAKIDQSLRDQLDSLSRFYAAEKANRENWLNGANKALENYLDYVDDAASRANRLLTEGLSGFNETLTDSLFSGDFSGFKDYGDKIAKQILAGILEQQITGPLAQWLKGSLNNPDSGIGSILGGLTGTSKTGENWLGGLLGTSTSGASGVGAASAAASTTAMAASATAATAALSALAVSASAAAAAQGGSSLFSAGSALSSGFGSGAAFGNVDLGQFFSSGGYTGDGGKYQPAGIVHAGEGVLSQEDVRSLGGKRGFNALRSMLRRGYSGGGLVGALGPLSSGNSSVSNSSVTHIGMNFQPGQVDRRTGYQIANDISLRQRQAKRYA